MQTSRTCQSTAGLKSRKGPRREHEAVKATYERLSTPKQKDKRWIPDRPSVYWLDYIIDPTPHKLKSPDELANYYDNFEPRFPRTTLLSAPRKYYGKMYCEDDDELNINKPISENTGIPMSALTYKASDRIKELARPKTSIFVNDHFEFADNKTSSAGLKSDGTSRQSLSTARSRSPKGKVRYFDPNTDLAGGDFPSRSKHSIHMPSSKERVQTAGPKSNIKSILSRSNSGYNNTGSGMVTRDILRNDNKRSVTRTLYSIKR